MTSIASIPVELLHEVFRVHVWENADSPQRLLRISRHWRSIVINAPALWGDILFSDKVSREYHRDRIEEGIHNKILCETSRDLAAAINRVGSSQFELTVMFYEPRGNVWDDGFIQPACFSRCRALRFIKWGSWPKVFRCDLTELERLDLADQEVTPASIHGSGIIDLLETVARSNNRLWALRVPSRLVQLTALSYSNLKLFHIFLEEHSAEFPLATMPLLTELKVAGHMAAADPVGIPKKIPPSLQRLHLKNISPRCFPLEAYANLNQLTLQMALHRLSASLILPQLSHLTLIGSWQAASWIEAPDLQTLALYMAGSQFINTPEEIRQSKLRPQRLDVDLAMSEKQFQSLLREQWREVEDLTIVYVKPDQSLWNFVTNALLDTPTSQSACPNLWRLTILSPERAPSNQEQSERRMRRIWEARKGNRGLLTARYGWYKIKTTYGTHYHNPRNGKVRWINIE